MVMESDGARSNYSGPLWTSLDAVPAVFKTVCGNPRPQALGGIDSRDRRCLRRAGLVTGDGGASWAATKARDVNLGRSHVVVHVVIRGFERARNRSNRHARCRESNSKPSKSAWVELPWV